MRGWRLGVLAAASAAGVALAAVVIARGAHVATPMGDIAVIESYTIRAAGGHLLVGPYSRFQWHHPGPLYFYTLAPFYAASHHLTSGLNAAAVAISFAMLVLAASIALARGGPLLGSAVTATLAVYVFRASDLLTSPWNPHVVVLPMVVAALAAAGAAAGAAWCLPIAAGAGSFAAQTHVGTLPTALFLGAAGLAGFVASTRRGEPSPRQPMTPTLVVTALVLVGAWLPTLIEQAKDTPGNLTTMWNFFVTDAGTGQPFHLAFPAWASMLGALVRPDFSVANGGLVRAAHRPAMQAWAIGELLLLTVAGAAAFRRRRRFEGDLCVILLGASLIALWSVTRIEGDIMGYEILWISALGAVNAAVAAAVLGGAFLEGAPPASVGAAVCGVLLAACAAGSLSRLGDARTRSFSPGPDGGAIEQATAGTLTYLRQKNIERPFVDIDQNSWGLAAAVLLQLQKAGVSYAVDDDWLPMFTDAARATGAERVVLSIAGAQRHVILQAQPGVVPVVERDPVFVDAYGLSTKR